MKKLFLALALMGATPAYAGLEFAPLNNTCGEFVIISEGAQTPDYHDKAELALGWIGGYLSGSARNTQNDFLRGHTLMEAVAAIYNYCQRNPTVKFDEAVQQSVIYLVAQHKKT